MGENTKLSKKKAYFVPIVIMILFGAVLFLPAGSVDFWQGWIYWFVISAFTLFITAYFLKKSPDLIARRMKTKEDENTDKPPAILKLFFLGYFIPGLDFRFHWSNLPVWIVILSNIIVFLGYLLIFFVFKENRFASTVIGVEDQQQVISKGLYSFVRHPMYSGLLLLELFTPLALGSYWAIPPFLLIVPLFVIRIKSEEKVLAGKLKGYKDYCSKIRYRLIPFIW